MRLLIVINMVALKKIQKKSIFDSTIINILHISLVKYWYIVFKQ